MSKRLYPALTIRQDVCSKRQADRSRYDAMSKFEIAKEFWEFLKTSKKWWLAPIVIGLVLLGAILVFASNSPLAPFIYSFF